MILINIHAGRTYTEKNTLSRRRRRRRCAAEYTRKMLLHSTRRRERNRERGLGVCVIYFTLWRPHKDVAQPTAKILQAAAAVARRRLRNLNCAPYIISPNRTHTNMRLVGTKTLTAFIYVYTRANGFVGRNAFFALVINFYGLTTRAGEKTRSIIYIKHVCVCAPVEMLRRSENQ